MRTFMLAVALCVCACSKPAPPTLTPERASITQVSPTGLELSLELAAANPNSVDLSAREITAHVRVANKYDLGTVTIPNTVTLPAGKTTKLSVPVSTKWEEVGALVQLAASNAAIPYSVDGTLSLGGDLVSASVPFHLDGSVSHDQIVGATLKSIPALPGLLK